MGAFFAWEADQMKLFRLGFFRELTHGDPMGPSLKDLIGAPQHGVDPRVTSYLNQGRLFIACPGHVTDFISGAPEPICSPNILTDGTWAWPEDLIYYVQKYQVQLDFKFLKHVESLEYQFPKTIDLSVCSL